jgi:8-hydroxy-5-deazaflavin:NADPH oxidoreductase
MVLGLIGTGMIGGTLARLAVAAGVDVVLSNSRGPESLADLVTELGGSADGSLRKLRSAARAATPAEAAGADLVVATIPLGSYAKLPADALAGTIVIDTMNYYPQRDGNLAVLDSNELTSSELVQRHLAESTVVKAFNNISFFNLGNLARPAGAPDRSALPIAGDDPSAKTEVAKLLDTLGFDAVDIGALADSWRSEPETPVYVQPYTPGRPPEGLSQEDAFRWLVETPGTTVAAGRVKELTENAVRGQAGGKFPGSDS